MNIALDVMGGDRAPAVNLSGAAMALVRFPNITRLLLVGDEELIRAQAAAHELSLDDPHVTVIHAPETISMEESGTSAVRRKKKSSVSVAMDLVKSGEADAFVSAGNTGACVAAAQIKLRLIPGIERAGIASSLPNEHGVCQLLDAGANPEARASHLLGYAIMGSAFARGVYGVPHPTVGLMSNGQEEVKGTSFTKDIFTRIREFTARGNSPFEFVGNVEGHDLFTKKLDVCLCDGFVGNIVLKTAEATAKAMSMWLKRDLLANPVRKFGAALARGAFSELRQRTSAEAHGGSPLLGVNGVVIIAHGGSTALAICNAIRVASETVGRRVNERIIETLNSLR